MVRASLLQEIDTNIGQTAKTALWMQQSGQGVELNKGYVDINF
jgi:hypothetical protein